MSIGEFEAVGDAIKEVTSEHATVVVGTVIDPEMTDTIRVTVVVTGLGRPKDASANRREKVSRRVASTVKNDGTTNYSQLDRPAFMRTEEGVDPKKTELEEAQKDMDYLDIPAFLRRSEIED
jgi:cell division protein FtsZ